MQSATRGIVGDTAFAILPEITPRHTFYLTVFYQLLALIPVFIWPTHERFLGCLTLCGYASYLFGWHVHEKAILLVIFPISFLALRDRRILAAFVPLAVAGYISLFPLIFTSGEELIKNIYTFVWFVIFMMAFNQLVEVPDVQRRVFLLDRFNLFYMIGFVPLMFTTALVDRFIPNYEFLKLMAVSVYCSIGIIGSCVAFWWLYFFDDKLWTRAQVSAADKDK
jgi:alpha-1,3-glucosyltransferase